jgi:purine nucleosidase
VKLLRRFLIDTDTASDDAVALVMALRYPGVKVEAITVVAGNVPLDQAVQNALFTVELCGAKTPVHAGLAAPLMIPLKTAQNVHGRDGMGDIGLPLHSRVPARRHAVDVLIETINRHAGEIELVSLGPLTNLACALLLDPSLAGKVKAYTMMGGIGQGYGNVNELAEYNIWADPEAARIVFESGLPITMVGWDISRLYAAFDKAESARFRGIGTPLAEFSVDIQGAVDAFAQAETQLVGYDLPDPIAMAVALDPSVATDVRHLPVTVDIVSPLGRGQTVVDHLQNSGKLPNARVVLAADRTRFLTLMYGCMRD